MGCLIFSASDAMAQGRSRSQGGSSASRSQSAAVSRSSQSTAATMSRNTNSSSMSRSTATPQVSRTSSSSSSSMSRSTATPQVSRTSSNSSSSMSRSTATPQVSRSSSNSSSSNRSGMSTNRSSNDRSGTALPSTITNRSNISKPTDVGKGLKSDRTNVGSSITDNSAKGSRPNVTKGGSGKPGNIDKGGNDKGGSGKPGNIDTGDKGRKPGNGGIDRGGNGRGQNDNKGRKPGNDNRGRKGNNPGYNPKNRFDYSNHHYRDDFHRNYTNHSWSWNRPLPPPVRAYRPVLREWYRPVVPYGWHPYTGAPVIDRILGITFGTLFNTSIEYLYYNGYEIDGYADHVIYLRDVALVNHLWDDVMLCFDGDDRLVNAQFVYHSSHIDRYRYNRIYNSLCRVYGSPITSDSRGISWFGGSCNGWITLANYEDIGHYYMTLSIGF